MRGALLILFLGGCSGSTGSDLVSFKARAGGPVNANGALEFDTGFKDPYHVVLSQASFHFGAVYLNESQTPSGAQQQPCVLPGIYVGEAFGGPNGLQLDLLSPELIPFGLPAEGTGNPALEAEVWLTSGDINADSDPTPVLEVAGIASRRGMDWPFSAAVTIGDNRKSNSSNPATPGANPICRQRIVNLIPVDFALSNGGTLDLRVDPSQMFNSVDFALLTVGSDGRYVIPDKNTDTVSNQLFSGVVANSGVYQFSFTQKGG